MLKIVFGLVRVGSHKNFKFSGTNNKYAGYQTSRISFAMK